MVSSSVVFSFFIRILLIAEPGSARTAEGGHDISS